MDYQEVMRTTFAARDFTGEPIPDTVLYEILDHARFAPSGGNRQGGRVIVVRDAATKDQMARLVEPASKRYAAQVAAGENPWNPVVPTTVSEETIRQTPVPARLTEPLRQADVLLVFVVDLRVLAVTDQLLDRVGIIGGASIYPLVWNTLLAARAAGFGGTLTTISAATEPQVKALLEIPPSFALAAVVPLGRPVKQLTRLKRLTVEEFTFKEHFGAERFSGN
ncbi:MAG: nitroreductase [Proteobacteria bacterium]|jgi:nitroreductase|nr:nitroreductase [Pseudomonadota bacterium]MBP11281.1 nitroreductase [Acidiferrobacteraceae bacterium]MDP6137227.1 nitroreductase family protein [Arenicellales bacterium]HCF72701.1 nitroreductase [Gammaproteobacteria bacterium]MDP6392933.1 nitroreductase family protein [Arenicellales bacterium]|tara:strand:- start:840 stop:1508 length:669 start_codon:yes stop_codon:yes gene_type:complete